MNTHTSTNSLGNNNSISRHDHPADGQRAHDLPSQHFDIIVLAASAGGVQAVSRLLSTLPADLPVPIVLVQHRSTHHPFLLPRVLGRRTSLKVKTAVAGERLHTGTVYVAPPDKHLLINRIILCRSPMVEESDMCSPPLTRSVVVPPKEG